MTIIRPRHEIEEIGEILQKQEDKKNEQESNSRDNSRRSKKTKT